MFKINSEYYLELLSTMKLLGGNENKITKDRNGENIPHLEIAEVILVQCNHGNNYYQEDSRVLHTLVPDKLQSQLLEISPTHLIVLKTFISEFFYMEVWFTKLNSKLLETE